MYRIVTGATSDVGVPSTYLVYYLIRFWRSLLVCTMKWQPLIWSLQNVVAYCASHGYYPIRFWRSSVGNCYLCNFLFKHFFGHISARVSPIDVKQKGKHRLDTAYNLQPWPLTSLMTLTLDASRSNFEIAVSQELLVWLMWNEKEAN